MPSQAGRPFEPGHAADLSPPPETTLGAACQRPPQALAGNTSAAGATAAAPAATMYWSGRRAQAVTRQ